MYDPRVPNTPSYGDRISYLRMAVCLMCGRFSRRGLCDFVYGSKKRQVIAKEEDLN